MPSSKAIGAVTESGEELLEHFGYWLECSGFLNRTLLERPILTGTTTQTGVEMIRRSLLTVLVLLYGSLAVADEQRTYDAGRGELLYSTHCVGCHNSQVHWRDKKLATDWSHLLAEVRHWEGFTQLGWAEDDVIAVARYLNTMHYHYPHSD